jgi:large subunit ribosomal protein L4
LQGDIKEPKTKDALAILKNLGLSNKKTVIVINEKNDAITKSFRNIEKVKYILVNYLNPEDILNCDKIVFREDALSKINS